jgi:hypothetical protein
VTLSRSIGRRALGGARLALIAVLLCASIVGCGGGEPEVVALPLAPLPGDFFGEWPVQTYVARTPSEWQQIWDAHTSLAFPPPAIPIVDFGMSTVVGVALGFRPSGCNAMQIVGATDSASEVLVQFRELLPPPGVGCAGVVVFLVQFATIPKTDKPVKFIQIP